MEFATFIEWALPQIFIPVAVVYAIGLAIYIRRPKHGVFKEGQ